MLTIINSSGPIIRILDDILVSCQNAATLESAHQLLRTLTSNQKFSGLIDTAEMLEDVLDGIGFGGLWRSSTFHAVNEHERQCTALTDRLIEVSYHKISCFRIDLIDSQYSSSLPKHL
jgi:neurofibromin 1